MHISVSCSTGTLKKFEDKTFLLFVIDEEHENCFQHFGPTSTCIRKLVHPQPSLRIRLLSTRFQRSATVYNKTARPSLYRVSIGHDCATNFVIASLLLTQLNLAMFTSTVFFFNFFPGCDILISFDTNKSERVK